MARGVHSVSLSPETSSEISARVQKDRHFNFSAWVEECWKRERGNNSAIPDAVMMAAEAWAAEEKALERRASALKNAWEGCKNANQYLANEIKSGVDARFSYPSDPTYSRVLIYEISRLEACVSEFRKRTTPPPAPTPPEEKK